MLNIDEIATIAKEEASRLKISVFDISGSLAEETNVKVRDGEAGQMGASQRNVVTVRVWNAQKIPGTATTTALDSPGLAAALQTALETSAFAEAEHAAQLAPEALIPVQSFTETRPALESTQTLLATLIAAERRVVAGHAAIQSVPYNALARRNSARFYVSSAGAKRFETHSNASFYLYTKAEEPPKKARSAGSFDTKNALSQLDIDGCVKKAIDKTVSHLNYKKIPSGLYTVVFSPHAFLDLIDAFSNFFDAQAVLDKHSLATEATLGTVVASPLLSLQDNALHPSNPHRTSFDGEGSPTAPIDILKEGVLNSFLHSAGTAKRMNTHTTGHARLGSKISIGTYFYVVQAAQKNTLQRSVKTEPSIIYVDELEALHAGVNALQGSFSLPISGWIYENGKATSIDSATIAGDYLQVLKSIVFMGDTSETTSSGVCPDVWVENVAVTCETSDPGNP